MDTNTVVYLYDWGTGNSALLYQNTEDKVKEFMKFWIVYRPSSDIKVQQHTPEGGIVTVFRGRASAYVNP